MRPLASLLAVVTTVATPAVLAACLTFCMPGMRGHAMAPVAVPDAPAAAVASPDAGCPEHQTTSPAAPGAAVTASADGCCVEGLPAAAPSVTAERAGTQLRLSGVVAPIAAFTIAPSAVRPLRIAHDRGAPPPPLRRPSVLRI